MTDSEQREPLNNRWIHELKYYFETWDHRGKYPSAEVLLLCDEVLRLRAAPSAPSEPAGQTHADWWETRAIFGKTMREESGISFAAGRASRDAEVLELRELLDDQDTAREACRLLIAGNIDDAALKAKEALAERG